MELRPVKNYAHPSFPTKTEINASPELLRILPKRWQQHALLGTLLAGIGMVALPSLLRAEEPPVDPGYGCAPPPAVVTDWLSIDEALRMNPVVARVAPIFPYPGFLERSIVRGYIGYNPQFLAEDEARKIIIEEAAKAGLTFEADAQTIENIPFTIADKAIPGRLKVEKLPLLLDGTDAKQHISYEYVSQADISAWQTAGVYPVNDLKDYAVMLHEKLTQTMIADTTVVFYDPASQPFQGEDLRQQVKDFIIWLKAEGVI